MSQLKRFIEYLPPHSRYVAAVLDDPEVSRLLAQVPEPEEADLGMAGYDHTRALLTAIIDAINQNTLVTIAAAGGDAPEFKPAPRPVTGVEKARNRMRHDERRALVALALGKDIDDIS